jgi:hypothetical protein
MKTALTHLEKYKYSRVIEINDDLKERHCVATLKNGKLCIHGATRVYIFKSGTAKIKRTCCINCFENV